MKLSRATALSKRRCSVSAEVSIAKNGQFERQLELLDRANCCFLRNRNDKGFILYSENGENSFFGRFWPNKKTIKKQINSKFYLSAAQWRISVYNNSRIKGSKWVKNSLFQFDESKSLFLIINNSVMPSSSQTVAELDQLYKNEDGFLYMNYSGENTFGA